MFWLAHGYLERKQWTSYQNGQRENEKKGTKPLGNLRL